MPAKTSIKSRQLRTGKVGAALCVDDVEDEGSTKSTSKQSRPAAKTRPAKKRATKKAAVKKAVSKKTILKKAAAKQVAEKEPSAAPKRRRSASKRALTDRVVASIERELDIIETIMCSTGRTSGQSTEAERRVRTLASLARTLAELKKVQASDAPGKPDGGHPATADSSTFRLDLARRLGVIVRQAKKLHPDEDPDD